MKMSKFNDELAKNVIMVGAGGHAKVLLNILKLNGINIAGVIDKEKSNIGKTVAGNIIVGDDNWLINNYKANALLLANGIGSLGKSNIRQKIFDFYKKHDYRFAALIHPQTVIADSTIVGEGVQIMAGVVIQPDVSIGDNSIINTRSVVEHDCVIGRHSHLAPGSVVCGGCCIGNNVHIGAGATVIQGINIADDVTVGAGAVVVNNIGCGAVVYGVPARRVSQ